MAPAPHSPFYLNIPKLLTNSKLAYSTSSFPPNLKHLFSKPPITAASSDGAVAEPIHSDDEEHDAIPAKTRKSRTMAQLINSKPWSARLPSSLSAYTPLSQTAFFQTLRRIKDPSKALRFFKWARHSGFTHNHHSYFIMLEILGRARNLNPARNFLLSIPKNSGNTVQLTDKFFNSLIRSYGDAGLFQESIKLFKVMKSMAIVPSAVTFNSLFHILLKRGRLAMVHELYDEMLRTYGVKPDSYTFNILIRGLCKNSKVDEAFRRFKEMDTFNYKPDLITYNTIVDGLCRVGKVNVARNVVNGMLKKSEDLRPNVVTYTTLIRGFCGKRDIDKALGVFREMIDGEIKPNNITCNTLIQGLCESQKFDMLREVLEECERESDGFVPDTCTFNTLMNAHCNNGNLKDALGFLERMEEMNVKQDSATYSILIRALCQNGNYGKAEELLDELFEKEILLHDNNCTPLAASFNPVFEYLCANGKTKKAEKILRQLMKRGTQDPVAFETLILGHCKEDTFEDGHKLLVLMLRRYFLPSFKIYESLIKGLLRKQEADLAHDTLEKMVRSSYLPRTSVFHCVLTELIEKGFARESADLMLLMLDKEIRPNINLSSDVVRLLFKSRMRNRAFELVKRIYENGYVVGMEELVVFLCRDRKLLEAYELMMFSVKNDQHIGETSCSTVLTELCKGRRLSEAFQVYYELLEKGVKLPMSCLVELRSALEAGGKLKEAQFVAKRTSA
ncbi:pentatricopeptide repeat-containing protein [Striga asiatica]|uniref:Pentatricopeptide repeat-containing protein n=1 Tax=Striga asiatica TaxID=4170 RepID=A0A5A7R0J1_STRAF|nr:pentatricopeptide repeat-containing protein [Striga asiatica]